jgi:DNA-binding SARP family transcriptional activator
MLRIAVLGSIELRDGHSELPVPLSMPRVLLGLLALRPDSVVPAEEIIDGLWVTRRRSRHATSCRRMCRRRRRHLAGT